LTRLKVSEVTFYGLPVKLPLVINLISSNADRGISLSGLAHKYHNKIPNRIAANTNFYMTRQGNRT